MGFELHQPSTFEEAWDLLEQGDPGTVRPIAGGTDLLLAIDFRRFSPAHVVSLARLPLASYHADGDEVRIGSMVPLRTLELDTTLQARLPALVEAIREVGSVQLRHRATLGGNIVRASPASDLLPPLVALGARVTLLSRGGRRTVPLEGFLEGSWRTGIRTGELIEEVVLPVPRPGTYRWQRVRPANDISQVGVAVVLHPGGDGPSRWRIVAGGTSPTVQRLAKAEAELRSAEPSAAELSGAAEVAAEEARFSTDLRAAEDYRRHLLRALVRRALETTIRSARRQVGT